MGSLACRLAATAAVLSFCAQARAGETESYSYDSLGRLIGVHGGLQSPAKHYWATRFEFDAAGNRTVYEDAPWTPPVAGAPPANQPPTTAGDIGTATNCTASYHFPILNDSDPDGDNPLRLVAVSAGTIGSASVYDAATVRYVTSATSGTDILSYTVADGRGAASIGTLTLTITRRPCPSPV